MERRLSGEEAERRGGGGGGGCGTLIKEEVYKRSRFTTIRALTCFKFLTMLLHSLLQCRSG